MHDFKKQEHMSISDLFDSGFKKRNEDHFAAIVRVAMDDGIISEDEKAFLDRLARNLDISEADYKLILKDYQSHPINPPTSYDKRLERLYDLARMVYVDHIKGDHEELVLRKIGIGLGFTPDNVKYVVDKALTLVSNGVDLETFMEEIKNMNK
ncbi:TerB family tellurite resistance protein [Corallibacter vietnamensis]|uniref:TerB family tellurite resistance protein n=2 Tax=Flavobacteriaceae TaxID=49546 RepID=A0ABP7H092_9FLAO